GVDVQRIRRALGLRPEPQPDLPEDDPRRDGVPRDQLKRFEQHLRRELERSLIERTSSLPPKRPLNELDRALPSGPIQDLAAVHKVVAQLKRRLATQGHELKGRRRHAHVDFARTNGRPPREDVFAAITQKAGRTFWLNPEPRLYWNYGDSVIAAYEKHCKAFECWNTEGLNAFVQALMSDRPEGR